MDGVFFRVLGAVAAVRDGRSIALGGPRQRALLALLLLEAGRAITAGRLIDELWAGEPPDSAEVTLRSYLSRLRSALGADVVLATSSDGYSLHVDPDHIDSRRFELLIRGADAALAARRTRDGRAALADALELWGGRPYGELGVDGSLRDEAERLIELRLHALERRIEADLDLGLADELVDELEAAVRDHPFREPLWHYLMVALYRAGRQADALGAYQRARDLLDEQLGIEPGEALEEVQLQVLRHEVPAARGPEPRNNLPTALTRFIGREAELDRVVDAVRGSRLVTLTGVGGVGKTRLSQEAARRVLDEHPDGVWFIDLAPLTDPGLVAGHIGAVLEFREQPGMDQLDRLVAGLAGQHALLLLDNCEHLREAPARVAQRLLATVPGLRILATSRELLGVPGEVEVAVPPLALPRSTDAEAARASDAVALLLDRVRSARPDIRTDDDALPVAVQIVRDLDGLPLAIELAAARARALSLGDIAARLDDRFRFLVSWRRLASARHRTLREAMDWSFELLGVDERALLARLAVFAGGFDLEAVTAICAGGDDDAAVRGLERLVDASLVVPAESELGLRYGLLETVRQYAAERLDESGQGEDVRRRHAEHFAALAEAGFLPLRAAATQSTWLARLHTDRDNFRAALEWSLDRDEPGLALRMTDTLWFGWWVRGETAEARVWLERTLAADHRDDPVRRARCLVGLAGICWTRGDYAAGMAAAEDARTIADAVGDDVLVARAANTLGVIAVGQDDAARAHPLFVESAARYRAADLPEDVKDLNLGIAIDNLGSAAHALGDDEEAMRHFLEARAINEGLRNTEGIAMNDLHLAILDAEAGRHPDARGRLRAALSTYVDLGFLHYVTECLEAASVIANGTGAPAVAAYSLGAAAQIHHELANPPVGFLIRLRDREAAAARAALGDEAFEGAYAEGFDAPAAVAMRRTIDYLSD